MYLARQRIQGKLQFFIRESFRDGELIRSRELFRLGSNPARFIIYPGGNAFYIDDAVTEALSDLDVNASQDELEDIFWPFLHPRLQRILEPFRHQTPSRSYRKHKKQGGNRADFGARIHHFDRRRLCYLKCGCVNARTVAHLSQALFRRVMEKSRDEIEQHFMAQESCLKPLELRSYAYAVFDLQRFFPESFAREHPQWLDQEKVEECFTEEVCRLHQDTAFWAGEGTGERLHAYLRRYVIMFFDHEYEQRNPFDDMRAFIHAHRAHRAHRGHRFRPGPQVAKRADMDRASVVFEVTKETLQTMTRRGLTRRYRRLAKKWHPDKGGSKEKFVELTEIYHALLAKKSMP